MTRSSTIWLSLLAFVMLITLGEVHRYSADDLAHELAHTVRAGALTGESLATPAQQATAKAATAALDPLDELEHHRLHAAETLHLLQTVGGVPAWTASAQALRPSTQVHLLPAEAPELPFRPPRRGAASLRSIDFT